MADQFNIQETITFVQATPPTTFLLMGTNIIDLPVSYDHGKMLVAAGVTGQTIASNVHFFTMFCTGPVSLIIGAVTLTNVTYFSYKGDKASFGISTGSTPVNITYASDCTS